jgi:hypothetical protein
MEKRKPPRIAKKTMRVLFGFTRFSGATALSII